MTQAATVLIVENELMIAEMLARLVQRYRPGTTTITTGGAAAARQILQAQPVAAVLTDYRLADGSALDVLAAVQAQTPAVPVMVISGAVEIGSTVLAAGAAAFLVKPFALEDVEALLQRVL